MWGRGRAVIRSERGALNTRYSWEITEQSTESVGKIREAKLENEKEIGPKVQINNGEIFKCVSHGSLKETVGWLR